MSGPTTEPALRRFVKDELARPFAWGATDCAHTGDRWARLASRRSFIAALGVDFADEAGARALMARLPMPVWIGRAMRAAGFARTDRAEPGDLGIVRLGNVAALALMTGAGWLWRDEDGMHGAPATTATLAIWRIE